MNSMTKLHIFQELVSSVLRATVVPVIVREIFQRRKVTILFYHEMSPMLFEKHLKYLSRRYSIISLEEFIKAKEGKNVRKLPVKPMVITFDDGKKTTYELKPVIQKHNVPVTFFVCSDIIGENRHFWFDHSLNLQTDLTIAKDAERLRLLEAAGFDDKKYNGYDEALSETEIAELIGIGISIQSHTRTHPILPMCDDSKAKTEITESKLDLERKLGIKVDYLAYPNGDYLRRDIDLCKKAGYLAAVTTEPGFNGAHTDLYRLKRISINDSASVNQLAVRATGVWHFVKRMSRINF